MKKYRLFLIATVFILTACTSTSEPTPTAYQIKMETEEARQASVSEFTDCQIAITDKVDLLEEASIACGNDYDCRAIISQQIIELGTEFESTCFQIPVNISNKHCYLRLIKAKAYRVHGAPNETGRNYYLAVETLEQQVIDVYRYCFGY